MPLFKMYKCPVCEEIYSTEKDAKSCLDECKWNIDVTICYVSEKEYIENSSSPFSCASCEHVTKEGYYSPECPNRLSDKPSSNCSGYAPAHDLWHVVVKYKQYLEQQM